MIMDRTLMRHSIKIVLYSSFEVAYPVVVRLVWQSVHVYRAIAGTVESRLKHIEGGDILLL